MTYLPNGGSLDCDLPHKRLGFMDSLERINELKSLLQKRILIIDGAMGTQIQARGLGPDDFGGADYEGCNEYLNITRPDVIAEIHRDYLQAGADIVETNTFGATALVLGEYDLAEHARRVNREGASIARRVRTKSRLSEPEKPRFVAGVHGPYHSNHLSDRRIDL